MVLKEKAESNMERLIIKNFGPQKDADRKNFQKILKRVKKYRLIKLTKVFDEPADIFLANEAQNILGLEHRFEPRDCENQKHLSQLSISVKRS